jgi:putative ABC transport system ATP-binding protein
MKPLISIRSISKSFTKGKTTITPLDDLSLDVAKGEFISLMGPSGSGKTTLLNLIAGIDTPTKGEIIINDKNIARKSSPHSN